MASLSFVQPLRELRLAVSTDLAIDLGTSNTIIYAPGRGVVLNEPSVVAIDNRTNEIFIAGHEAKMAIGREPQTVRIVRPIRDGVIADFDSAQKMLAYFMRRAMGRNRFLNPRVVICAPGELTPVERRALEDATYRAGAKRVEVIESPVAAAAGAGEDESSNKTFMIVDIGGGTTDIAVMSCGGAVHLATLRTGGNAIDKAIADYVRYKRGLEIGVLTAEAIKFDLASLEQEPEQRSIEVRGRSTATGMPEQVRITGEEVREAVEPVVTEIIRAVRQALEELPPEVAADLIESGITLSGGGSQIVGLKERFEREAIVEVRMAPDPMSAAALGAGRLMQHGPQARKDRPFTEQRSEEMAPARAA